MARRRLGSHEIDSATVERIAAISEDRLRNLELLAKYVMPEIKAYAEEIGLRSPFETPPGDLKLRTGEARGAVVDRTAVPHMEG